VLVVSLTQERTGRLKVETEAERVRLTAGEGEVENLAISTPRAGPQSRAKKYAKSKIKRKSK
jgi:hypothetical protein